ncbi:hypothetical protein [Variovorax sp. W2I14]|uniref:hypothetical protein n=1 Tax=Variovorax sp. W2I14 TaxID=3042290 RepID=UPI003D21D844
MTEPKFFEDGEPLFTSKHYHDIPEAYKRAKRAFVKKEPALDKAGFTALLVGKSVSNAAVFSLKLGSAFAKSMIEEAKKQKK